MNQSQHIVIEFLGTGTSTGVPQLRCHCPVCNSADPRDKRLRASIVVRYLGMNILIDCGPDFRTQMLRASDDHLDALLLTHIHYDHVGGLDDLRTWCLHGDLPIYARHDVIDNLHDRLPYCFAEHPYPGTPQLHITPVSEWQTFSIGSVEVQALPVMHYRLPILGYRIGPLAYITDAKTLTPEVADTLRDIPLLVVNALRHDKHLSHFSLDEALDFVRQVNPGVAYLTHMSHGIGLHAVTDPSLPDNVHLAYDGLIVSL